jgi:hypothetical protein
MVNIYQLLAHIYINGKKATGKDDDMKRSHEVNKIKMSVNTDYNILKTNTEIKQYQLLSTHLNFK